MKVKDIMNENVHYVYDDEYLSKALGIMKEKNVKALVVLDRKGNYKGMITERRIHKSYVDPSSTRVRSLLMKAPVLSPEDEVEKAAHLMFHTDFFNLPVKDEEGKVVGTVNNKDLIEAYFKENPELGKMQVKDVMTEEVVTLNPSDSIAKALSLFREHGFTRAPVVDSEGRLLGLVTLHDIVVTFLKPKTRPQKSNVGKEKVHVLRNPVKAIMETAVITAYPNDTLLEAIQKMKEYNISSLIVVGDKNELLGIITDKDMLEVVASAYQEEERFKVMYSLAGDVRDLDKDELEESLKNVKEFFEKYAEYLGSGNIYVYIKEHEEKFRGVPLYHVRIRASTERGLFVVTGETWGLYNAIGRALKRMREQIEYKKALDKDPYEGLKRLIKEVSDKTTLPVIRNIQD
ncbi:MAG: CBS domain-containing protein [Candidatus Nanohaloarchaeota archaeon]|nr:CBS domain-containing protein [Candidatus Nanohaloarchaeota archaeon]